VGSERGGTRAEREQRPGFGIEVSQNVRASVAGEARELNPPAHVFEELRDQDFELPRREIVNSVRMLLDPRGKCGMRDLDLRYNVRNDRRSRPDAVE